jgi:cytochrome P450
MLGGQPMSLEDAERECFLVTVGGQDTSPAFVSAFVEHVLQNPSVHSRLVEEIDLFDKENKLSFPVAQYDETTNMPFFMACVQETLRMEPSASLILPRYAPKAGLDLGGTWVPGGTEIAANPYVIHRNKVVFGVDAHVFRPERWLENPLQVRLMKKYFFAFGYGSRKCLGKNIALFPSQKFCVQVCKSPTLSL